MDEMEFTLKVLIIAIFIELMLFVTAHVLGTSAGISNPTISAFTNYTVRLNASEHAIGTSWNYTLLTPATATPGSWFDFTTIYNAFIAFPNLIAKIVSFGVAILASLWVSIELLFFMLFGFIPGLIGNSLGPFGPILALFSWAIPIIVIVFSFNILTKLWSRMVGGGGK